MFCPKCGGQNPEEGKFCRSCGTDLGNVSDALSGKSGGSSSGFGMMEPMQFGNSKDTKNRKTDPNEIYGDAVKNIISGIGFIIVSMALLFTNVANGSRWWWAMLFPAFTFLAKGISDYLKSKKMEQTRFAFSAQTPNALNQPHVNASLPPTQTEFVSSDPRYKTGDLVPPSVTEGTTRHLELDSEGQTMALPKK